MAKYIDAHNLAKIYMGKGKDKLEPAPTADVQEVKHAKLD